MNREPYELDPVLFRDGLPHYANTQSVRVVGGLGTIARIVSESDEIYREPLSVNAALERINRLYTPYHETLSSLMDEAKREFGFAVLIDCHSMPPRPHAGTTIVFGDRHGTSAGRDFVDAAMRATQRLGFGTACNVPYAGGYIVARHGRPQRGVHALQMEIDRSAYLDAELRTPGPGFAAACRLVAEVALELGSLLLIADARDQDAFRGGPERRQAVELGGERTGVERRQCAERRVARMARQQRVDLGAVVAP